MNQILIIIAIVGIGYLLYRSLVIKRQPTDDNKAETNQSLEKTSSERTIEASAAGEQRATTQAKPLAARDSSPSASAQSAEDSATPQTTPLDSQSDSATSAENQVGKEATEEVHQAEAKAAEKAHMATAAEATKSDLEQFTSGGLGSHNRPTVPPEVETQAAALGETDDPLARHRLYQQIVEQCYREREDKTIRFALLHYAKAHIDEFDDISKPLKKQNGGKLPQVATFKHYAAVLTDAGQYDEAIAVCQQALSYGLKDGTKTGYQGRIERIEKLKAKQAG